MKYLNLGWLIILALIVFAGCQSDDNEQNPPATGQASLTIAADPDTLWFVDGESASSQITVTLTDNAGEPIAGVTIHMFLAEPANGWLTFANETQGGATDTNGHAFFVYHTTFFGTDAMLAAYDTLSAMRQIVAAPPYHESLLISLTVVPATFDLSDGLQDTVHAQVTATATDNEMSPVPGLTLHFFSQHGWCDPDTMITDADGHAMVWWNYPESDYPEELPEITAEIGARIGDFEDSQLILIRR